MLYICISTSTHYYSVAPLIQSTLFSTYDELFRNRKSVVKGEIKVWMWQYRVMGLMRKRKKKQLDL